MAEAQGDTSILDSETGMTQPAWHMMRWFEARYPGICAKCDEPFEVGTQIRADGHGGYQCCETTPPRPLKICTKCFIALPATGICDTCG